MCAGKRIYGSAGIAIKTADVDIMDYDGFTIAGAGTAGGTTPLDQRNVICICVCSVKL